jgi:hypothetical protein
MLVVPKGARGSGRGLRAARTSAAEPWLHFAKLTLQFFYSMLMGILGGKDGSPEFACADCAFAYRLSAGSLHRGANFSVASTHLYTNSNLANGYPIAPHCD